MSNDYFIRAASMEHKDISVDKLKDYLGVSHSRDSVDTRINALIAKNRYVLKFLEIELTQQVSDHASGRGLTYNTSRYIGAVPTVMPSGKQGGDIQVYPNLGFPPNNAYEKLNLIFNLLGENIEIEYANSFGLRNPMDLKPPMFLEAIKYIDLYEAAIKSNWRKFRTERRTHSYAKSSTDWRSYAARYYDPNKRLEFVSNDSVLTKDHSEWRQLKYVYEMACDEIEAPTTPTKSKNKYSLKIQMLDNQVRDIKSEKTHEMAIHASDPNPIKELKLQANRFLSGFSEDCLGWRVDIAKVFERFVQHIFRNVAKKMGGVERSNYKISGSGQIPSWGIKYVEPDAVISIKGSEDQDDYLIIVDAKYKSNIYNINNKDASDYLKETHRHDLFQVLGYCSFAPQKNKIAILVYPSDEFKSRELVYTSSITDSQIKNTVLLLGIRFDAEEAGNTADRIQKIIQKKIKDNIV